MDPSAYNQILGRTRASNVVLRTLFVRTTRRNFSSRAAQSPTVDQDPSFTRQDRDLIFTYSYDATLKDEASEDTLMSIRAIYEVCLYCEVETPDEFAEEYMRRQMPLNTRPYFRELVSNCAPRALIQCPPVPAMFVGPVTAKKPEELPADASSEAS